MPDEPEPVSPAAAWSAARVSVAPFPADGGPAVVPAGAVVVALGPLLVGVTLFVPVAVRLAGGAEVGLDVDPGAPDVDVEPLAGEPEVLRGAVEEPVVDRGVLELLDVGRGVELGRVLGFAVELGLGVLDELGVGVLVAAGGAVRGCPPEPKAKPTTVPGAGSQLATPDWL